MFRLFFPDLEDLPDAERLRLLRALIKHVNALGFRFWLRIWFRIAILMAFIVLPVAMAAEPLVEWMLDNGLKRLLTAISPDMSEAQFLFILGSVSTMVPGIGCAAIVFVRAMREQARKLSAGGLELPTDLTPDSVQS